MTIYSQSSFYFIIIIQSEKKIDALRLSFLSSNDATTNEFQAFLCPNSKSFSKYNLNLFLVISMALDRNLNEYLQKKIKTTPSIPQNDEIGPKNTKTNETIIIDLESE